MKYEEIKVGDIFTYCDDEETVIYKNDKRRIIVTIDYEMIPTTWAEDELYLLKPIKEELPEEGLLVGKSDSLVYKLSDGSAYGFGLGKQSNYRFYENKRVILNGHWEPATPEQEKKFIEMLKKECESRGLYEDTKIEKNADGEPLCDPDFMGLTPIVHSTVAWNKNGQIFHKGNFATPRKEETLELVSKAVQEMGDFTIEQTKSGVIILTKIKK